MMKYIVVYDFVCPNCKTRHAGQSIQDAPDERIAALQFAHTEYVCDSCPTTATFSTVAKVLIRAVKQDDLLDR